MKRPDPSTRASLRSRTLRSALWLFSGAGIQGALRLGVLTLLARMLGPEHFGLAAAALVVTSFFTNLLQTGVRPVLIQRAELEPRHIETGFVLALATGVSSAGVVLAGSGWIARTFFDMPDLAPLLRAIALMLPLQGFGLVARSLLERELRFDWLVRNELVAYVIGYAVVGVSMAFLGFGVWALVAAYLVHEGIYTLAALLARPHAKTLRVDRASLREIGTTATGFLSAANFNFVALQGDKWVAGRFLGEAALGLYKYAYELTATVATLFAKVMDQVLFPAMASVQHRQASLQIAYQRAVSAVAVLVFPTSALLAVLAPEVIALVLGPGWEGTVAPFRIMALALLFRATYKISDSLARATGAVYRRAWRQAVYAGAVLLLAALGAQRGLDAIAWGVAAAISLNAVLMADLSTRIANVSWADVVRSHLGALPCFALSALTSGWCAAETRALGWPPALVVLASGGATAAALLLALALAPRALLGKEGSATVATLLDMAVDRFPRAGRLALVSRLRSPGSTR